MPDQPPSTSDLSGEREFAIRERALAIEEGKLALEREKLEVERVKAKWTAVGAVIPIAIALFTIIYGVWSLQKTNREQFEAKVADLALASPDPDEARNRARVLARMFPDLLPADFDQKLALLKPGDFGIAGSATVNAKKEFFKLMVEHPERREESIRLWMQLFPDDIWAKELLDSTKEKRGSAK